ncbi:MAG: hypothetical protein WC578_06205 [Candidatus Omnitrophota bacterium]|jgi:hypothetical protein
MKLKIAGVLVVLALAGAGLALGEDQVSEVRPVTAATAIQENNDSNTQWVWGEVTSVDVSAKTLTLEYLDYETDQEREIILSVDDSTAYDNVKSLEEIRVKDNLSIDYFFKNGKSLAKSISLEKSEGAPVEDSAILQPEATAAQGDVANAGDKPDTIGQSTPAN